MTSPPSAQTAHAVDERRLARLLGKGGPETRHVAHRVLQSRLSSSQPWPGSVVTLMGMPTTDTMGINAHVLATAEGLWIPMGFVRLRRTPGGRSWPKRRRSIHHCVLYNAPLWRQCHHHKCFWFSLIIGFSAASHGKLPRPWFIEWTRGRADMPCCVFQGAHVE